jgi:hypothetical protein
MRASAITLHEPVSVQASRFADERLMTRAQGGQRWSLASLSVVMNGLLTITRLFNLR